MRLTDLAKRAVQITFIFIAFALKASLRVSRDITGQGINESRGSYKQYFVSSSQLCPLDQSTRKQSPRISASTIFRRHRLYYLSGEKKRSFTDRLNPIWRASLLVPGVQFKAAGRVCTENQERAKRRHITRRKMNSNVYRHFPPEPIIPRIRLNIELIVPRRAFNEFSHAFPLIVVCRFVIEPILHSIAVHVRVCCLFLPRNLKRMRRFHVIHQFRW